MNNFYTDEKNALIVVSLLKQHGIRRVIASPGTTNMALVASLQHDRFFKIYSAVDERSAAYMACGLATETNEPVVISCTGATASRNYLPGLTEAYYRKLPILAVTSTQAIARVGHHEPQVIDRSTKPIDTVKLSVTLPIVKDAEDVWECEMKVNRAILELTRHGGGPVHINLPTTYNRSYKTAKLPQYRKVDRIMPSDAFPDLPNGRIGVLIGAHKRWKEPEVSALEQFCQATEAVVFCDHTSNYHGTGRVMGALIGAQKLFDQAANSPDVLIHIGEITGDYYSLKMAGRQVWRVSEDGELRDTMRKLRYIFEMSEEKFFSHYASTCGGRRSSYRRSCEERNSRLQAKLPTIPFSNIWLASRMAHRIPTGSTIHFGILNSLRAWNFFDLPASVSSMSNVGGFGIDGGLSALIGASLADRDKLYFAVIGDLAFFYDFNVMGNRHVGPNVRILLVNNGKGIEFRHLSHTAAHFGDNADEFISAAGHFGQQSRTLVKNYATDLGFDYLAASNEREFEENYERFLVPKVTERPILFEVFTTSDDETRALDLLMSIDDNWRVAAKRAIRGSAGFKFLKRLKGILRSLVGAK